jgi:hypothetical protein
MIGMGVCDQCLVNGAPWIDIHIRPCAINTVPVGRQQAHGVENVGIAIMFYSSLFKHIKKG